MKKHYYFLLVAVALTQLYGYTPSSEGALQAAEPKNVTDAVALYKEIDNTVTNTLTNREKNAGWQLLFNGSTIKGWHGYNQQGVPDCWMIEDNCLTTSTKGGHESQDLLTDKKYKNFALSVEYKLTKGANSGILFQIKEDPKYTFAYETGPEFQLIDHENWPDPLEDWQISGSSYAMYPPAVKSYKKIGEWNQAMIVVDGNEVTFILNGEVTVKYTKYSDEWTTLRNSGKWANHPDYGKFDEGSISLQNHGTRIWYKNVKIKEL
jgi:hypothetical protein